MTKLELIANNVTHQNMHETYKNRVIDALSNDFHTAEVMTIVFEMQKELNKTEDHVEMAIMINTFEWLLPIIGIHIDLDVLKDVEIYLLWQQARALKNFKDADEYRKQLMENGYI